MPRTRPPRRLLAELAEPIHVDGVTYQQRWILCSSTYCDDRTWHGPYWYAFWKPPVRGKGKARTGGVTKTKYVGRKLPKDVVDAFHSRANDAAEVMREAQREVKKRRRRART